MENNLRINILKNYIERADKMIEISKNTDCHNKIKDLYFNLYFSKIINTIIIELKNIVKIKTKEDYNSISEFSLIADKLLDLVYKYETTSSIQNNATGDKISSLISYIVPFVFEAKVLSYYVERSSFNLDFIVKTTSYKDSFKEYRHAVFLKMSEKVKEFSDNNYCFTGIIESCLEEHINKYFNYEVIKSKTRVYER